MSQSFCPSAAHLKSLVLGTLPAGEFDRVIDHLDACATCEETVSGLEATLSVVAPEVIRGAGTADTVDGVVIGSARGKSEVPLDTVENDAGSDLQSSPHLLPAGTRLGNYRIRELIGRGGMGQVYLATQTLLDRDVALKVLPSGPDGQRDSVGRFQREMKIVAMLTHENIVSAFDAGVENGLHYLSMPLLRGQNLGTLAEWWAPLPVPEACEVIRQAASGLQHAHSAGIIHRDVKPSNLMLAVDESGACRVKVLDLGLARSTQTVATGELTTPGQIMGTLDYLAPEQAFEPEGIDHRTDIYGLGATLYRLLTGRIPLQAHRDQPMAKRLLVLAHSTPQSLSELRSDVPAALVGLIDSLLSISPKDRPQSMAEVVERLQSCCPTSPDLRPLLDNPLRGQRETVPAPVQNGAVCAAGDSGNVEQSASNSDGVPDRRRRPFTRGTGLIIAVIVTLGLAAVFFVQTPRGTVEIRSELEGVVVSVVRNGDRATHDEWVIRRGTSSHRVRAGDLSIQLPAELNDVFLVEQDRSHLTRNGRIVATIRRRLPQLANGESSANVDSGATVSESSAPHGAPSSRHSAASATQSDVPGNGLLKIPDVATLNAGSVPNEFPVHPALTRFLARPPVAEQEFEKNRLFERSKDWLREFRDGRLILDTLPAKRRLDAWPIIDLVGSGLVEIDVQIVNGSGWLVVFHNSPLNRGFQLSLHEGRLVLEPSLFNGPRAETAFDTTGAATSLKSTTLMDRAPSRGLGNFDRLHVLIEERQVTTFLNGVPCGEPVSLDFDLGRHRVCLGVFNIDNRQATRIEFERIRKYALSSGT